MLPRWSSYRRSWSARPVVEPTGRGAEGGTVVLGQLGIGCPSGGSQGTHDDVGAAGKRRHLLDHHASQPPSDPVTDHCAADRLGHDEPHSRAGPFRERPAVHDERRSTCPRPTTDRQGEVLRPTDPKCGRKHPGRSGGQLVATLAPTSGEDRAAGSGAHAQPEAMGLGPTPVVRLEGALRHFRLHRLVQVTARTADSRAAPELSSRNRTTTPGSTPRRWGHSLARGHEIGRAHV